MRVFWVKKHSQLFLGVTCLLLLNACIPVSSSNTRGRLSANSSSSTSIDTPLYQGKILADNPAVLTKNINLSTSYDLNKLTSTAFITTSSFLESNTNCYGLTYCFVVKDTKDSASALQTSNGKWGYKTNTKEFLQVNTYYHLNKILDQFFSNLIYSKSLAYTTTGVARYDSAIPWELYNNDGSFNLHQRPLQAFANCDEENNASYNQADEFICLGYSGAKKDLYWAHDSSIIYHETGHFLHRLQINFRNSGVIVGPKPQLGSGSIYSEAGSIGEGLADYYSYYVTSRTHWGEWAAGKLGASRPLTESDPLHVPGLSESDDERLSYPQYITYNPNNPTKPLEDVHTAGGIVSHYLVALTKDLESKCSMSNKDARVMVMHLLSETLAELGDYTTVGTVNGTLRKVNLNTNFASTWFKSVNPINYRSFMQTLAKNIYNNLGNPTLAKCNGSYLEKDSIESLIDQYGLLLFKTYNNHRNLTNSSTNINMTVNSVNRRRSSLISKSNLILDPTTGASSAFVIDGRESILSGLQSLQNAGVIGSVSDQTPADLSFNNSNSKVSPGEIVAIALNLYNNSNSIMGGVQVLANDWDHADSNGKPCLFNSTISDDMWPLKNEGGSEDSSCSTITASSSSDFAPICFFQLNEANSTKWVSQNEFRENIALDQNLCLDKTSTKDCLIRTIKGADRAYFSKINPKSNWGTTMADPSTGKAYGFSWGNLILFEISKHIPPGTVVNCRMRARFTNCDNCFHDSSLSRAGNDFLDTDYNGPNPFKIINLQIPITD